MSRQRTETPHMDWTEKMLMGCLVVILLALVAMVVCMSVTTAYNVQSVNNGELYAKSGTVTEVNVTEDAVTFVDTQGYAWTFTGCEDWQVGDRLAAVMHTMGTDTILDDAIVGTPHYEG